MVEKSTEDIYKLSGVQSDSDVAIIWAYILQKNLAIAFVVGIIALRSHVFTNQD